MALPASVLLADDLTGAAAVVSLLRSRGLAPVLFHDGMHDLSASRADALSSAAGALVVVNTQTRDVSPRERERRMNEEITRVRGSLGEAIRWHLRIDSTLRGAVRAELAALVTSVRHDTGVLAPSYPDAGRTTSAGVHRLGHRVVGDLVGVLEGLPGVERVIVGDGYTGAPGTWWIPDVASMKAVREVSDVIGSCHCDDRMLIVSSGLLSVERIAATSHAEPPCVLVVQGSSSARVRRQVLALNRACRAGVVVLRCPTSGPEDTRLALLIADAIELVDRLQPKGIVVGGGLTAQALLEALEADALEALGSPGSLIGLTRIIGGRADGALLATKGGWVGAEDSLIRMVDLVVAWPDRSDRHETEVGDHRGRPSGHWVRADLQGSC